MKIIKHLVKRPEVIFLVMLVLGLTVSADEKKQEMSAEDQKIMELYEKYAAPGENHKHLEYFIGEWESQLKMWVEPGAEPMMHKQEIKVKSILGNRFLKAQIKGTSMGKPYEGMVLTGYDNYKKKTFAIQVSTLDTGYFVSSGTLDKTGKVRTETGIMDDIITGEKIKITSVTTIINNDKYTYEMYQTDSKGSRFKSLEITYTRKK
jgi:hypothetical protein